MQVKKIDHDLSLLSRLDLNNIPLCIPKIGKFEQPDILNFLFNDLAQFFSALLQDFFKGFVHISNFVLEKFAPSTNLGEEIIRD